MSRRCWTCDTIVTDFAASQCNRKWCTAKRDVEKELANGSLPASAVADYTGAVWPTYGVSKVEPPRGPYANEYAQPAWMTLDFGGEE